MIDIAHLSNGGKAVQRHKADLSGGEPDAGVSPLFVQELTIGACTSNNLPPLSRFQFDVMDNRPGGNIAQGEGIARFDVSRFTGDNGLPYMQVHGFIFSPLKIFEYMSLAKALVASDLDKIREVVSDRRTGLLVKAGSPEDVAQAVEWLVANPADAARMGRRARRTAVSLYSWERLSTLIERALRRACAEGGAQ